ncbi:putative Eukaryotic translation initiation factor 5A [Blattamonas nauphoetae]|uniref:Eukaryotic translation initiation factor 5A n=1 Tax=Blattamonas nauphoetae TaxID=2049346 RepID=A0ABQ9Y1U8_9EUKA|nr:putative Eukaryotic translation initiation factor 5A [Blattamonas nauphoetae]
MEASQQAQPIFDQITILRALGVPVNSIPEESQNAMMKTLQQTAQVAKLIICGENVDDLHQPISQITGASLDDSKQILADLKKSILEETSDSVSDEFFQFPPESTPVNLNQSDLSALEESIKQAIDRQVNLVQKACDSVRAKKHGTQVEQPKPSKPAKSSEKESKKESESEKSSSESSHPKRKSEGKKIQSRWVEQHNTRLQGHKVVWTSQDGTMVPVEKVITSGIWRCDMRMTNVTDGGWTPVVGICQSPWDNGFDTCFGNDTRSMDYNSTGRCFHNSSGTTGNSRWGNGDVVGMEVDMRRKVLSFYLNGTRQRVIFTNIPSSVQMAVGVGKDAAEVELMLFKKIKRSSYQSQSDDVLVHCIFNHMSDDFSGEEFEGVDDSSSQCRPLAVNDVRIGTVVAMRDRPSKVVETKISKPGKHGSAKMKITSIDLFNGKKYEAIYQTSRTIPQPDVIRADYQLTDVDDDGFCSLMGEDGIMREDLQIPADDFGDEVRAAFAEGKDLIVCTMKAMGIEAIMSMKEEK